MALEPIPSAPILSTREDAQAPKKKKIKTTKVVNGVDTEVEIEVDDVPTVAWPERSKLRVLNHDIPRVDGPDKVSGAARYTHDVRLPGMVYAQILVSPLPRAKVVKLDVEAARKVKGVVHVLVIQGESTGWLGDPVAAVAAETLEAAQDGLRALAPKFEALPWSVDHETATKSGAPAVTKNGNLGKPETDGDETKARAALQASPTRVKATYQVPIQHHACLETHGVVVDYRGGTEATVYCSTQYTHGFAAEAAEVLGLPASSVTGINEHMGGGFGSKFGMDKQGQVACQIAKELKRPVHLMLGRREEFLMSGNRSGGIQTIEAGCEADGKFTGFLVQAFKHGGLGRGSLAALPYCYSAAEHYRSVQSVRMHLDANRAMRAPGSPQASFPMESIVDELAYAAGIDLVAIRKRNLPRDASWQRQLDRAAREIGWADHPHKTKPGPALGTECIGIGFGVSAWGGGGADECEVEVRIERDGSVVTACGSQDLGTGTRTYMAAITAEEFGLPVAAVAARLGNSRLGNSVASGGSVTTASLAPAVKDAAAKARVAFATHLAAVLGLPGDGFRFEPEGILHDGAKAPTAMSWKKACGTLPAEGLRANGRWVESLASRGVNCTQAARVAVDPGTGRVLVLHMVCVQEVGLPLNRLALRSQIQGGMIQALGYAISEGRVIDPVLGIQLNPNFEDYKVPHALEIPRMTAIIDDEDTRQGVIGVGEPPVIPGAGAIANAVHNACGARVRELPITPDKVLQALGKVV
ncbi:MAG: xanthine dehydrogenase family protein molybdopterin-binding subunit [Planctomycetota bacterium]|nr:xanthine dehydrogenase family protein molybdopterin-binding subunit [Planctomycetota bacterium]